MNEISKQNQDEGSSAEGFASVTTTHVPLQGEDNKGSSAEGFASVTTTHVPLQGEGKGGNSAEGFAHGPTTHYPHLGDEQHGMYVKNARKEIDEKHAGAHEDNGKMLLHKHGDKSSQEGHYENKEKGKSDHVDTTKIKLCYTDTNNSTAPLELTTTAHATPQTSSTRDYNEGKNDSSLGSAVTVTVTG